MVRIRGIQGCLSSTRESMQIAEGSTSGTGEDMARIRGIQDGKDQRYSGLPELHQREHADCRRFNQWYRRGYGKDQRFSGLPEGAEGTTQWYRRRCEVLLK